MPLAYYLAAVDTILACLLTMAMGGWTGYLRGKHKIEAPAVVGHPQVERAHRTHINTVEKLVLMIPFLWIASVFYGGQLPFWLGLMGGEPNHLCHRLCAGQHANARARRGTWIFGSARSFRAVGDRTHVTPRAIPLSIRKIPSTATFHASERT